ncbi:MAG: hypothetical protein HKP30_18510 [Myxococcales bacterium]|nr:hypothetical protein [Myxococcales bacterium]
MAWYDRNHLATLNLAGNVVHGYRFDPRARRLHLLQTFSGPEGDARPENLAFSPDGRWLAITHIRRGGVDVHAVDRATGRFVAEPRITIRGADRTLHGVGFSACSRYLAFTTLDEIARVRLFRIREEGPARVWAESIQDFTSRRTRLKPKGVDFAPNGRFAAICYAPNVREAPGGSDGGLLCIHRCRPAGGIDPHPVSTAGRELVPSIPEDVRFFPDGAHVAVSSQASDVVTLLAVDPETGAIQRPATTLRNPRARLSFPHGLGISPDGRFLAVSNYGDDTIAIFAVRGGGAVG